MPEPSTSPTPPGLLSGPLDAAFLLAEPAAVYRPRQPQRTDLYRLLEALYEQVKLHWEERFESRYGRWRGLVDEAVARFLDCGVLERGFARCVCQSCQREFVVALSCKGRGLCPSCAAKRGALFAAFLSEQVLEPVGHSQWVFTVPKMLRPYFLHHRELLGELCRAAYETVTELMGHAIDAQPGFRPGFVAVLQSFNSDLRWNPHLHAIVTRGGWTRDGRWVGVAHLDPHIAERLFRSKVLQFLRRGGLLDESRAALLLSWKHRTGFSVHNSTTVDPDDTVAIERLARYFLRSPVSSQRVHWDDHEGAVRYTPKSGHGDEASTVAELYDPLEFIARILVHVPAPRLHLIRYWGAYSAVARARRRRQGEAEVPPTTGPENDQGRPASYVSRLRWADLLRRIYEVDPLTCTCGGSIRIISFIFDHDTIRRVLNHLRAKRREPRAPP